MIKSTTVKVKTRSVHRWISSAFILFGFVMIVALAVQAFSGQRLVEHKIWLDILHFVSADYAKRIQQGQHDALPANGVIKSWYIEEGQTASSAPSYLRDQPPGFYSSENSGVLNLWDVVTQTPEEQQTLSSYVASNGNVVELDTEDQFHALIVPLPTGRLITFIDITEFEAQQDRDAAFSVLWAVVLLAIILTAIYWLRTNLVYPVRDLANRMREMNPEAVSARLPTTYTREEIQIIAQASNAHLERVEQFIKRERSLLDQASHEFRTPVAVISGAVDVLKQQELPDSSKPALHRIELAVTDLSEMMVSLLYLAREAIPDTQPEEIAILHEVLPRLLNDHEHLLSHKSIQLTVAKLEETFIAAPEAMIRIAVSNLIRNAIENTDSGTVELSLENGIISVSDSGKGFDPAEAARLYRNSLRQSLPVRGQGLGLFLIGRICDRFGWKLSIKPTANGGTKATLDVTSSIIPHQL